MVAQSRLLLRWQVAIVMLVPLLPLGVFLLIPRLSHAEHEMRLYMLSPPSGRPLDHPIEFVGDVGQVPLALVPSEHRLRRLPCRPIWPGFGVNTIFCAATLWLLIPGPFALRRFVRRRRGLCPGCAYPVGGSVVCSECGIALGRG